MSELTDKKPEGRTQSILSHDNTYCESPREIGMDQPKVFLKQFGLQRSGTNILKALIEINFPGAHVLTRFLGNKHNPADWNEMANFLIEDDGINYGISEEEKQEISDLVDSRKLRIIVNIKEPIPWLESYHRYQRKKAIRRNPNAELAFDESWVSRMLGVWEANVGSWVSFVQQNSENCVLVRQLQIFKEPEAILNDIEKKFSLSRIPDKELVCRIGSYARRGTFLEHGEELIITNKKFDPSFHLDNIWIEAFSPELLDFTIDQVNELDSRRPIFREMGLMMCDIIN